MRNWLDLKHAAEYCCLSVRTLRTYIGHHRYPLPVRRVGGKWLISCEELDRWVQQFPKAGEHIDRVVEEVLKEMTYEN